MARPDRFTGKVARVTGAGSGIGRAVAFAAALGVALASDLVPLLPRSFVLGRAAASPETPFAVFPLPLS